MKNFDLNFMKYYFLVTNRAFFEISEKKGQPRKENTNFRTFVIGNFHSVTSNKIRLITR